MPLLLHEMAAAPPLRPVPCEAGGCGYAAVSARLAAASSTPPGRLLTGGDPAHPIPPFCAALIGRGPPVAVTVAMAEHEEEMKRLSKLPENKLCANCDAEAR